MVYQNTIKKSPPEPNRFVRWYVVEMMFEKRERIQVGERLDSISEMIDKSIDLRLPEKFKIRSLFR